MDPSAGIEAEYHHKNKKVAYTSLVMRIVAHKMPHVLVCINSKKLGVQIIMLTVKLNLNSILLLFQFSMLSKNPIANLYLETSKIILLTVQKVSQFSKYHSVLFDLHISYFNVMTNSHCIFSYSSLITTLLMNLFTSFMS